MTVECDEYVNKTDNVISTFQTIREMKLADQKAMLESANLHKEAAQAENDAADYSLKTAKYVNFTY